MARLGLPVSVPPPLLKIEVAGIAPVLGSQAGPIDPAGPWSPAFRASIVTSRRRVNVAAQHPGAANWAPGTERSRLHAHRVGAREDIRGGKTDLERDRGKRGSREK